MESWQGERCKYCGGRIEERRVDLHRRFKGAYHIVIENVPAGVCRACGARFYAANVLDSIEETIRSPRTSQRNIRVPVYSILPLEQVILNDVPGHQSPAISKTSDNASDN